MVEHSKITPEVFDNLLYLSRLSLEENDTRAIAAQVEQIISYFDILNKFDSAENTIQCSGRGEIALRSDTIGTGIDQAAIKKITAEYMDGYFRVPKVLEGGA